MPKLGFSMERGTVVEWLKHEGDPITVGEPVVLIESEKVQCEVEALGAGTLRRILVAPGAECPPGQLLGVIAHQQEDIDAFLQEYSAASPDPRRPGIPI